MTIDQHLREIGVIAKPQQAPPQPTVDRSKRGWVPAYRNEEPPF